MKKIIICVDFDGTCVTHDFPKVGKDIGAAPVLKKLVENGHRLILWTMRDNVKDPTSDDKDILSIGGEYLTDAVNWFVKNDIPLFGINGNPEQKSWTGSPKAYGHLYIDDAALGVPLLNDPRLSHREYVDWEEVNSMLGWMGLIPLMDDEGNDIKTV